MQLLNPRTPLQAVAWAKTLITGKDTGLSGLCDHFVALAYGWGHSGDAYALKTWDRALVKHEGERNPPVGALVVWSQGTPNCQGHIALSAGGGCVISTDVPSHGRVDMQPFGWFDRHWHSFKYLGWIQPAFLHPSAPISKPKYPAKV